MGRDLYDYALLSARVGAYQSFWSFATEGPKPTYSYQPASTVPLPQPTYQAIQPIIQPAVSVTEKNTIVPVQTYAVLDKGPKYTPGMPPSFQLPAL